LDKDLISAKLSSFNNGVAKQSGQGTTASPTLQTCRDVSTPLRAIDCRLLRGHTLLASPPELDIFFRTRYLVPSCECGSRFCRRWQVPNLLCRLHLVSVVLASGATL
ncbi:unnamed protein product, partial [Trichogramma brassicae]